MRIFLTISCIFSSALEFLDGESAVNLLYTYQVLSVS